MIDPKYETIDLGDRSSFRSFHHKWRKLTGYPGWHFHPEYEINYMIKGSGTIYVGDSVSRLNAGEIALIGPNIPHSWNEDEHLDIVFEIIVIQFPAQFVRQCLLPLPEASNLRNILAQSTRGLHFKNHPNPKLSTNFWDTVRLRGISRLTALLRVLDELQSDTRRTPLASEGYVPDNSEFNGSRMTQIVNYVQQNLDTEIVQSDIALTLGMRPASFSRFFRNVTGRTFISYVNVLRVSEACRLLATTEQDITSIAFSCGYANISHFNRQFRELRGMTPSEYRRCQLEAA